MDNKTRGLIAYIFGVIGGIIVLNMTDSDKNTKIHAAQSISIFICIMALNIISSLLSSYLFGFGYILSYLPSIFMIIGIIKVIKDEDPKIPVINDIAINLFGKQINK